MDPAPQQVGVDAVSHRHCGHRDARLLRSSHCLRLELGAVNSPPAAWRCLVHSAYVPIKSLMDTSILGTAQRINMPCQDAYDAACANSCLGSRRRTASSWQSARWPKTRWNDFSRGSFDAVLTDIGLPSWSGVALVKRIHDRAPSERIVFIWIHPTDRHR